MAVMLQQFSAAVLVGVVAGEPYPTYKPVYPLNTSLEFTIEDNGKSGFDQVFHSRTQSSCWSFPGLDDDLTNDSNTILVLPDARNGWDGSYTDIYACPTSGKGYEYYQNVRFPLSYGNICGYFVCDETYLATVEFYGYGYNRSGTVEWEYGCRVLDRDHAQSENNHDFKVSCDERPRTYDYPLKGYNVTVQPAAPTFKCIDSQCVVAEDGVSSDVCAQICTPQLYTCIDNQCQPAGSGVPLDSCSMICDPQANANTTIVVG